MRENTGRTGQKNERTANGHRDTRPLSSPKGRRVVDRRVSSSRRILEPRGPLVRGNPGSSPRNLIPHAERSTSFAPSRLKYIFARSRYGIFTSLAFRLDTLPRVSLKKHSCETAEILETEDLIADCSRCDQPCRRGGKKSGGKERPRRRRVFGDANRLSRIDRDSSTGQTDEPSSPPRSLSPSAVGPPRF